MIILSILLLYAMFIYTSYPPFILTTHFVLFAFYIVQFMSESLSTDESTMINGGVLIVDDAIHARL